MIGDRSEDCKRYRHDTRWITASVGRYIGNRDFSPVNYDIPFYIITVEKYGDFSATGETATVCKIIGFFQPIDLVSFRERLLKSL